MVELCAYILLGWFFVLCYKLDNYFEKREWDDE